MANPSVHGKTRTTAQFLLYGSINVKKKSSE